MTGLKPHDRSNSIRRRSASPREVRGSWLGTPVPEQDVEHTQPQTGVVPASGFFGSTSYSAVFAEQQHIDLRDDQEDAVTGRTPIHDAENRIKEGCAVLHLLQDFPSLVPFVHRWMDNVCDVSLITPHLVACLDSIKHQLYMPIYADSAQDPEKISGASRRLFDAFNRPIRVVPGCSFDEFAEQFTGENVRWETLGIFFTACGLGVVSTTAEDGQPTHWRTSTQDKRALSRQLLDASNACISFCDEAGQLSDPGIWLLNANVTFLAQVLGDANYLTWRRLGDLSTAVFALGLHQEIRVSSVVPYWLVEYRRRTLAIAYSLDKLLCTFVGRPPRLSKRYCSIEAPVDLEFDDLRLDRVELEKKVASLDVNGWNRNPPVGRPRKTCMVRAFLFMSQIREEILELSLGPPQPNLFEIAADIARRNKDVWESFPPDIRYYPDIWTSDRSRDECILVTTTYLDIVYNDFMLQRTLVRRIRARSDEVIRISRLLITTLIDMLSNHGRSKRTGEDPWMIMLYGLPAAGVLALELLQQSQPLSHRTTRPPANFPRSEIVQNLSVFVSYLGWVHVEGDGNYHLCVQARRMLQRILDKVLLPQPATSQPMIFTADSMHAHDQSIPPTQQMEPQMPPTPDTSSNHHPSMNVDDENNPTPGLLDFSWMDNWNAEFEADFWMNLPDHPLLALDGG